MVTPETIRIVAPSEVRAGALLGSLDGFEGQIYADDGHHEVHVILDSRTAVALANLFHAVGAWLNDGEHSSCGVHFGEREFTLIAPQDGKPADATQFLLERTIQLQTALDTRLVLEQAKGILAERFGLDIEEAFDVLRGAARSNSLKIHVLAADVVRSRQVPPELSGPRVRLEP
jgi:ANTAR domain